MTTVYADNAATTQMSRAAIDAMLPYMETVYGNPSSLHSVGQQAAESLQNARERIAACLNASPREIYFTSGGSEADNQAILSAARLGARKGKKHIISTAFEHHAVLHTLKKLEKEGFEIELLPVGAIGTITAQQVKSALRADTCLVTVMYANNEIGSILPIAEIGEVCREAGVLFHTDAVQAAGHVPIDVQAQHIDMLSLSAHKFHGPKGIGVLYARQGVPLTSLIEGGAQERGKRAGTENLPAIMGMAKGKGDQEGIQKAFKDLNYLSFWLGAVLSFLPIPFLKQIAQLYHLTPEAAAIADKLILWNPVYIIALVWFAQAAPAAFRGIGDSLIPPVIMVTGIWVGRVLTCIVCTKFLNMGAYGLYWALVGDYTVRSVLYYWRYKSGAWLRAQRGVE